MSRLATAKRSRLSATLMLRHSDRARPTFIRSRLRYILRQKRKASVLEVGSMVRLKRSCAFRMCTTRTLASPISNLLMKRALPRVASSTNEGATFSVRTSRTVGTSSAVGTTSSGCKNSSYRSRKNPKNSFRCRRWTKRRSLRSLRKLECLAVTNYPVVRHLCARSPLASAHARAR